MSDTQRINKSLLNGEMNLSDKKKFFFPSLPAGRELLLCGRKREPKIQVNSLQPQIPSREGNGTPLQYSCLENPMDGGAW